MPSACLFISFNYFVFCFFLVFTCCPLLPICVLFYVFLRPIYICLYCLYIYALNGEFKKRDKNMCYEEGRVKDNRDICWEKKKKRDFFSPAQTKMASSGFLGVHWQCCKACFFKWLILHLWHWINKLQHDKSLWFIMFPPVYNQVEGESERESDRGRLEETET